MGNDFNQARLLPVRVAIFDLDGCLFDDEWRMKLIKPVGHQDRFGDYHRALTKDTTLWAGSVKLQRHLDAGDGIAVITARPESARQQTIDMIRACFGITPQTQRLCLFMRGDAEEGIGSVELKRSMLAELRFSITQNHEIIAAYDDRPDVVAMYLEAGITGAKILDKRGLREHLHDEPTILGFQEEQRQLPVQSTVQAARTAADILEEAGATFRERNAVYKDNADNVGKVMAALFPDGVQIKTAADHKMYHLFELMVVKMTRFANSGLTHQDSIRDLSVYGAMVENLIATHNIQFKG